MRAPLPRPSRAPLPRPSRAPLPRPSRAPLPRPSRAPLPRPCYQGLSFGRGGLHFSEAVGDCDGVFVPPRYLKEVLRGAQWARSVRGRIFYGSRIYRRLVRKLFPEISAGVAPGCVSYRAVVRATVREWLLVFEKWLAAFVVALTIIVICSVRGLLVGAVRGVLVGAACGVLVGATIWCLFTVPAWAEAAYRVIEMGPREPAPK